MAMIFKTIFLSVCSILFCIVLSAQPKKGNSTASRAVDGSDSLKVSMWDYDCEVTTDLSADHQLRKCVKSDHSTNFGEDKDTYTDNTVVYVYDFHPDAAKRRFWKITKKDNRLITDPVDLNKEAFNPGTIAWLKVVNVNKFMYDVIVDDSVVLYQSEPNALFNQLFIGDSSILGGLLGVFGSGVEKNAINEDDDYFFGLSEKLYCLYRKFNSLHARVLHAYDACYTFPCCAAEISQGYQEIADELIRVRIFAASIQNDINNKKTLLKKLTDEQAACAKLVSEAETLKKEKATLEKDSDKLTETQKKRLAELNDLLKKVNEKLCDEGKVSELKESIANTKKEVEAWSAVDGILSSLPTDQDLRKLVVFINNMVSRNQEDVFLLNTSGNLMDLTLQIKSKDSIFKYFSLPNYNPPSMHIEIPIIRRPFVSFSSGPFMAFGDHLKNKTYSWSKVPDGSNTVTDSSRLVLVESGFTPPPIGFAALGSVEWKLARSFGVGASTGVGITIEKTPRVAYLVGGSVFFGNLRQFAVTAGVAGMQIEKIRNDQKAASDLGVTYGAEQPINYFKEFKAGPFFSITYTPFTTVKKR